MIEKDVELSRELFDRVVEASGLSTIIARAAVSRACSRAGVTAFTLTPDSLRDVIPHLERTLTMYIRADAAERIRAIEALARRPSSRPNK